MVADKMKEEGIRWLNDWRPIAVCLIAIGFAWGDLRKQQTVMSSALEKIEPYQDRITRLESEVRFHSGLRAHSEVDTRVSILENTVEKIDTNFEAILARLDRLIDRQTQ